jgi:hypothetical protein
VRSNAAFPVSPAGRFAHRDVSIVETFAAVLYDDPGWVYAHSLDRYAQAFLGCRTYRAWCCSPSLRAVNREQINREGILHKCLGSP